MIFLLLQREYKPSLPWVLIKGSAENVLCALPCPHSRPMVEAGISLHIMLRPSSKAERPPSLPARVPQQLPGAGVQVPCQSFLQAAQPKARSEGTDTILLAQTRNRGIKSLSHELGAWETPILKALGPQKFPCLMAEVGSSLWSCQFTQLV